MKTLDFALASLLFAAPALAADWTLIDVGTLGGARSFASAINDRGQVVGVADASDGNAHSFMWDRGRLTDLSPFNSETDSTSLTTTGPFSVNNQGDIASGVMYQGVYWPAIYHRSTQQISILGSLGGATWYGFSGVATAVNNVGHAVGYSYLDGLNRHAFIYQDGRMTDLGSFGGYSAALDINDCGVAVGFASDSVAGTMVAAKWARGAITPVCGNQESTAYRINQHNQIVGEVLMHDAFHAFLSQNGVIRDLGTLRTGHNSTAYGINARGHVVGTADVISSIDPILDPYTGRITYVTNYEDHAFLCVNGSMLDLNSVIRTNSGCVLGYAFDINESGVIVGWGMLDGEWRGYLLAPIRDERHGAEGPRHPGKSHRDQRGRPPLPIERWWLDWQASHWPHKQQRH